MFSRVDTLGKKVLRSRRGTVAIQAGMSLFALIGLAGLSTEGGLLLYQQRKMQSAADASALAGAMALGQSEPRDFRAEARAIAAQLGFVNGVNGVTVTVNTPPATGGHTDNASAVELILSQSQAMSIFGLFTDRTISVRSRSVGLQISSTVDGGAGKCLLALDPTASQSIYISNNAIVGSSNCGAVANSSSETAIYLRNNAEIKGPVSTVGNWSLANNAKLCNPNTNTHCSLNAHASAVADPYADVQPPTALPGCTGQSGSGSSGTFNLSAPGGAVRFCGGWNFTNNATLNLEPGTYYVDQALAIKNNATVNAKGGVTIVVNGNYAIDLGNNARLNITAPNSGTYAGMAFAGFSTTSTVTQKFSNNAFLDIKGAIYFRHQTVEVDNNGSTAANGCTQVIGNKLVFMNNASVNNYCSGTGVKPIGGTNSASIVE